MADLVKLEKVGSMYILTLLGEGEHGLNESMFKAIILALQTIQNAEDASALVTTNEGRFYSNGFDMDWLNAHDYSKGAQSRHNLSIMLATLMNMNLMWAKLSPKVFKDMFLLAKKHTANDAYSAGIVDSVHENSTETLKAATAWATQLSKRGFGRDSTQMQNTINHCVSG